MSLRIKAFALHLLASTLLLAVLTALLLCVWYTPWQLLGLQGGIKILLLMVMVDVILGPILTFLVVKPDKTRKMLIFDLSVIIAFQLAAFSYGAFTLYKERPVFFALVDNAFQIVRASDIDEEAAKQSLPATDGDFRWVFIDAPDTVIAQSFFSDTPVELQPKYYRLLSKTDIKRIAPKATALEKLSYKNQVDTWLQTQQLTAGKVLLFPLNANVGNAVVAVSADTALPLGVITE